MASTSDSDDVLLQAATTGDRAAFEVFFRRHGPRVLGFFARRVRDPDIAADLMAETFAGAVLGLRRYRRHPEIPEAWLFGIARNTLAAHHRQLAAQRTAQRRLQLQRWELEDDDLARIEQLAELADLGTVVRRELARLPEDQRNAVDAYIVQERSYRDIAASVGASEAVVRQRVSRGLKRLRKGTQRP